MRSACRLLALLLITCFAAPGWAKEPPAFVVIRPVINFHSGPRADSDVVSQALLGARLVEVDRRRGWQARPADHVGVKGGTQSKRSERAVPPFHGRDGWVRVKGDDDYPGWVQLAVLRALGASERYPASFESGKAVEVDALGANLYLEPDLTKHAPVLTAPFQARLERVNGSKDSQRWIEVRLPDRRIAWIQSGDVRTEFKPLSLEASLALAKRFLGVTYTWGGSSSFGFDCSGFTQSILRSRGVIMPRDANIQAVWPGLAAVADRAALQPGDLLFFGKDAAHITHTGMYLGKGSFIHDTTRDHPCVQISDLSDPYWSKLLVAMRRAK